MKITLTLTKNETPLCQMCEGQLMMFGMCEMADGDEVECAKYDVCDKILNQINKSNSRPATQRKSTKPTQTT